MTYANSLDRGESGCPFCEVPRDTVISENELAYAVRDAFPVTPLHTLLIPKRHVQGFFELHSAELEAWKIKVGAFDGEGCLVYKRS